MDNNIIVTNKTTFLELTPKDGYKITNWKGENIEEFTSSTLVICPPTYDINEYYTITAEEDERIEEEQRIMTEKNNNRNDKED